jgi:ATP-dependent Zn protease
MRKVKNEFMSAWDGLRTKEKDRVLVMGATNRPQDLDEAVVRRMPRRLMVDLPDARSRCVVVWHQRACLLAGAVRVQQAHGGPGCCGQMDGWLL